MTQAKPTVRRCAVYTRKSSEEGLEQDFNSLHAQREACEAFIRSQAGEGWKLVKDAYDDGGLSGGTLERPALQRLMNDIRLGKIDTVVVYKVDRLTRSLADFAKIVELFDGASVTFVAVTQQFNTTSSMGRLTLNILLSFAQFEREVTGERIRDKIAASKQKGMWMGGRLSLGYDVKERKLIINDVEAKTVEYIFERYLELKSVRRLQADLEKQGIASKSRPLANGKVIGGVPLCRGAIYALLANPIYVGLTRHKEVCYPGQHQAIIEQARWDAVQQLLKQNAVDKREHRTKEGRGLLTGKIFDEHGNRLTPTYTKKGGRQYRYYVSQQLITGPKGVETQKWRIPAVQLEQVIVGEVHQLLCDQHRLVDLLKQGDIPASQLIGIMKSAMRIQGELATTVPITLGRHHTKRLNDYIARVTVIPEHVALLIDVTSLRSGAENHMKTSHAETIQITLQIPLQFRQRGREVRLVIRSSTATTNRRRRHSDIGDAGTGVADVTLLKAIARARSWFGELSSEAPPSLQHIAARESCTPAYLARLLPLAFLAPNIVEAIVEGRHPVELTISSLTKGRPLPLSWASQRQMLRLGT